MFFVVCLNFSRAIFFFQQICSSDFFGGLGEGRGMFLGKRGQAGDIRKGREARRQRRCEGRGRGGLRIGWGHTYLPYLKSPELLLSGGVVSEKDSACVFLVTCRPM
jgi:hypothetical protein